MNKVYKYPLALIDVQQVCLPTFSKILCVKEQYGNLVLYVQVSSNFTHGRETNIIIVGTGHEIPDLNLEYINTVLTNEGKLVWHVYKEVG